MSGALKALGAQWGHRAASENWWEGKPSKKEHRRLDEKDIPGGVGKGIPWLSVPGGGLFAWCVCRVGEGRLLEKVEVAMARE